MPHLQNALLSRLLAALLLAVAASAPAAEPLVKLDATQLKTAGVVFSPVVAPGGDQGASLVIPGRVVVPNAALEAVLAPIDGRIESVLVNPGQSVRAGQPLVRLFSAELLGMQRELVAARAQAQTAESRARRDEQLLADGIIARNRADETRAQLTEAQARLREQVQLLRLAGMSEGAVDALRGAGDISAVLTLSARRNGQVLQQLGAPGDAVTTGTPLLRVARLDTLWVELQATREQAQRIRTGDQVEVAGCPQAGEVIAAGLQLAEQGQTVAVRVELKQPGQCALPNQFVEARVAPRVAAGTALLQVPAAALVQHQGRSYVFVRHSAGVVAREVQVERRTPQSVWLASGVKAGEEVASAGLAAIKGSWQGLGATAGAQ